MSSTKELSLETRSCLEITSRSSALPGSASRTSLPSSIANVCPGSPARSVPQSAALSHALKLTRPKLSAPLTWRTRQEELPATAHLGTQSRTNADSIPGAFRFSFPLPSAPFFSLYLSWISGALRSSAMVWKCTSPWNDSSVSSPSFYAFPGHPHSIQNVHLSGQEAGRSRRLKQCVMREAKWPPWENIITATWWCNAMKGQNTVSRDLFKGGVH